MAAPPNTTDALVSRLARGNTPPIEIPQALSAIFDSPDYETSIQKLSGKDLEMWVERLDQLIDSTIRTEQLRSRALRSLRKTCGLKRILPSSHYFSGKLSKTSNRPATMTGGSADVWRVEDDQKRPFAAKVFRANIGDDRKTKKYYKEVTVWKRLNHPNVLPTLGVAPDIAELCVISPWMPDGTLLQYLTRYPGANRASIMVGIAEGLSYLHFKDVVHGDLKGENVLFDNTGTPQISDFGTASITFDPNSHNASTAWRGYSLRWTPPEILEAPLDSEIRRPTEKSDVYAFAMVVVEIFTGKLPFPEETDLNFQLMVTKGKRPSKPADASKLGLSSTAWKIVEECWKQKRDKRPEMQNVVVRLRKSW